MIHAIAQKLVADFMAEHNAPLTCTSANVSGELPLATVPDILAQFGERASMIDTVIDDGPRTGTPSTVVKIVGDTLEVLREGAITEAALRAAS